MKQFITVIIAAVWFSLPAFSQMKVNPIEKKELNSTNLSVEAIQKLRNSQTVFFYRADDDPIELRRALKDVWTISDLVILPYSEIGTVDLRGKSYFVIEGFRKVISQYATVDNTYIYLLLYMDFTDKKGKDFKQTFARLDLFPTAETMKEIPKQKKGKEVDYFYTGAEISNWTPGFLRNYLRNINDLLEKGGQRGLYESNDEVPRISQLVNKTLYVPNYSLIKASAIYGIGSGFHDPEKLMKNYPYSYDFKSASEISDMILEDKDFYYLVYTRSSTEKYFTVFHSISGEIVFNAYKPMSYNLKDSDFKDIAESVKKMEKKKRK